MAWLGGSELSEYEAERVKYVLHYTPINNNINGKFPSRPFFWWGYNRSPFNREQNTRLNPVLDIRERNTVKTRPLESPTDFRYEGKTAEGKTGMKNNVVMRLI